MTEQLLLAWPPVHRLSPPRRETVERRQFALTFARIGGSVAGLMIRQTKFCSRAVGSWGSCVKQNARSAGRLIAKIQGGLAVRHIEDNEHGLRITDAGVVRGLIEWDAAQDGDLPLLVIDGRDISWQEFGRCVMSYEGFQFKMEIRDKSDEV